MEAAAGIQSGMDNNEGVKNQENGDNIMNKEEDYFTNLPSEIMIDILSRLPIRTIIACKVVCKSWCDFVTSLEFAKSHLSRCRSLPGLAVSQLLGKDDPPHLRFFEFIDEIDPYFDGINFKFPHSVEILSSVDGLLALTDCGGRCHYICNPMTREYIKLPRPPSPPGIHMTGLGVSKISGQYKLVRIATPSLKCEVYTLGTGSWRSIAAGYRALDYNRRMYDEFVFLKGVLHCLVSSNWNNHLEIFCFDLETELFSTLAPPSQHMNLMGASLVTLRDCLCFYHYSFDFGEINIWSMKEYGDDRLWIKEFVIENRTKIPFYIIDFRVFIDGDILMAEINGTKLRRFSPKTNAIRTTDLSGLDTTLVMAVWTTKVVYTPSFLPVLKTLVMEDVTSF